MDNPATLPDTLEEVLADAFRRLVQGAEGRHGAFHAPTFATRGLDGAPKLRTVVLRAFDPATRLLRIHTDRRSAKAAELAAGPQAMIHGYDAAAQVQIRIAGQARLHLDDAIAEAAWAATPPASRRLYAGAQAPGTPLAAPGAAPGDPVGGRANFAAVMLRAESLEWLLLAPAGHRRARFAWNEAGSLAATWIAP